MSIDELRNQIDDFVARRAELIACRASAEKTRKGNVMAAAGGDHPAQKVIAEARAELERIDAELTDLSEATAMARDALEAAEAEEHRRAQEEEHAEKLTKWHKALADRSKAVRKAARASSDLLDAFASVEEIGKTLVNLHRDLRVQPKHGLEPIEQVYGVHSTVERWTACANGIGLTKFLRRLDSNATNPPSDLSAEDACAIAKIQIAERPADAAWAAAPVAVPNRGDGFGTAGRVS